MSDSTTGQFEITISGPVVEGAIIEVTATSQEGTSAESAHSTPFTFALDIQPPTVSRPDMIEDGPTAGQFPDDNIVSTSTPTFDGTAEAGSEVSLYEGTTLLESMVTTDDETWTLPDITLGEGTHQITAKATDAAGNESERSPALAVTIDLTPPTISASITPSTSSPQPVGEVFTVEMTGDEALWNPEAIVRGESFTERIGLQLADGDRYTGDWKSLGREPGEYTVDFEARDVAGNSVKDVDAPTIWVALHSDFAGLADVNRDCKVNIVDLTGVRNHQLQKVVDENNRRWDVNRDGFIDIVDLIFVRNRLGDRCPIAAIEDLTAKLIDVPGEKLSISGAWRSSGYLANVASNAFDQDPENPDTQDPNTFWSSSASVAPKPEWLILDLGEEKTVGRVRLLPRADFAQSFPSNFTIELRPDGEKWTQVAGESGYKAQNGVWYERKLSSQNARYVRLTVPATMFCRGDEKVYYVQIAGFEVYAPAQRRVELTWTVPGDVNTGKAASYDIRYSTDKIATEATWESASKVDNEPVPEAAGAEQPMTITLPGH